MQHLVDEGFVALLDTGALARRQRHRVGAIAITEVVKKDHVTGLGFAARSFLKQLSHRRRSAGARGADDENVEAALANAKAQLQGL